MAVRTISTKLSVDGEKEFKRQMSEVNNELKTLDTEMKKSEAAFFGQANTVEALTEKDRILREEIAQQKEKIKALAQAVVDAGKAYGDTGTQTDAFRQQLNRAQTDLIKMNRALEDTDRYLDEARDSSDKTAKSIDGFGKEIKDVDDPLGDMKKLLGDLKNLFVGGAVVTGIKEIAGAVLELEESTREYRQIMGTLETSSQAAGYTAEETAQAYNRLYSVLGDTQTAATATANLQAIGLRQEDLMEVVDAAIGAWATYGDSIPIDGLTEAINETVQAGTVTGVFADVINWAGESEEAFNKELENTKSTAGRARDVMRLLAGQDLPELGQKWLDVNEDIVKANESQARMDEAMGRLGEKVAPLADGLRNFGANAIEWLTDKIEDLLPMLEGMAEVAGKVWDVITQDAKGINSGQYSSRSVQSMTVESEWRANNSRSLPVTPGAATAADMQSITAGAVNAAVVRRGSEVINLQTKVELDSREIATAIQEDLRALDKSNPEAKNDFGPKSTGWR